MYYDGLSEHPLTAGPSPSTAAQSVRLGPDAVLIAARPARHVNPVGDPPSLAAGHWLLELDEAEGETVRVIIPGGLE